MTTPLRLLPRRAGAALSVAALTLVLVACGDTTTAPEASPPPAAPSPATPSPAAPPTSAPSDVVFDLATRTVDIDADGWVVDFCEGDGPFVCVADGDGHVGAFEYGEWDLAGSTAAAEVLERGGTSGEALLAHARELVATVAEDRSDGCGPGYQVVAQDPVAAPVAGQEGLRYGFTGVVDGRTVEQVVIHAAIAGNRLVSFTAAGYAADGCLGREGEFSVEHLEAFTPTLGRLVAAASLPPASQPGETALADGTHTAWLAGIDGSELALEPVEVLSGAEARAAARADGQLGADDDLPNDVYVRPLHQAVAPIAVAPEATVELYDCTASCQQVPVPLAQFLAGTARPYGGDRPLLAVEVADGRITAITEQYLP